MLQNNNKELKRLAQIANNLTQEFTTPLSTLIAVLEEMQREEDAQKKQMQLDVALRNAYKYRSLTNDVFAISRILSGKNLHMMTQTDMVHFIKNLVALFAKAANRKKVELQFSSNVDELISFLDFQKLYKIVYKLIANGIRFSKVKSGLVKIDLNYNDETKTITIQVIDNGIGIIKEKLPHIFDLDYANDPIHLAHYQGTGIGLYLTKLLTESIGGTISVSSEKFKYSTFEISLPVFTNINTLPFEHIEVVDESVIEQLVTMQEVLHVDTDEIIQLKVQTDESTLVVVAANKLHEAYFKSIFKDKAELIFVNDIDSALGHIFDFVPDMVIFEDELNENSGSEAIQLIKKNSAVSHVPTVLFIPEIEDQDLQSSKLDSMADDLITLKTSPEAVRNQLCNLIENRKRVYEAAWKKAMNELKSTKSLSIEDSFLSKLNTIIDNHISDELFNVDQLSDEMFMSRTQIHRKLKAITSQSTTQYIKRYKLKKALKDLENHTGTIGEIAYSYGFSSPAYFSRVFHEVYGKKPSDVKRNE